MKYITSKEAAEKWGVSERMIRIYCSGNRIPNAFREFETWYIPENAAKPARKQNEKSVMELPKLVKQLQHQSTKKVYHGLYDYIQVSFCYSSCRMASNRLMRKQVEEVFTKKKVFTGFEAIKVDDLIEALDHFECVDHVINTAVKPLNQTYIRKLHSMLSYGTVAVRRGICPPGEYRKTAYSSDGLKVVPPRNISSQLSALIAEYENIKQVELQMILDFHVHFERIRPFADGNGRLGRLLMFKECLRHEIMPFVIDDKRRKAYYYGLQCWDESPGILTEVCTEAQARFEAQIALQKLMEAKVRMERKGRK